LVCKDLNARTLREFGVTYFTSKKFALYQQSIDVLVAISTHPDFAYYVKLICLTFERLEDIDGFRQRHQHSGPPVSMLKAHERRVAGQRDFVLGGSCEELLTQALERFPKLESMSIGDLDPASKSLRTMGSAAIHDATGFNLLPCRLHRSNCEQSWSRAAYSPMLKVALSACPRSVCSITAPMLLDFGDWNKSSPDEALVRAFVDSLRRVKPLKLRVVIPLSMEDKGLSSQTQWWPTPCVWTRISKAFVEVEDLSLEFTDPVVSRDQFDNFTQEVALPQLHKLSLINLLVDISVLHEFLTRHAQTLTHLVLESISITNEPRPEYAWPDILRLCQQMPKLRYVRIDTVAGLSLDSLILDRMPEKWELFAPYCSIVLEDDEVRSGLSDIVRAFFKEKAEKVPKVQPAKKTTKEDFDLSDDELEGDMYKLAGATTN